MLFGAYYIKLLDCNNTDDETRFDWIILMLLVQYNFYGLWPDAIEKELEIAEECRQRVSRLLEYGGKEF